MPRVKLYLSYDGTAYHGWQRQTNTPDTIQEVVENRISRIASKKLHVVASGRTDAGVHARVQVCHVDLPDNTANLGSERLKASLNSLLPPDVRVMGIDPAEPDFNAIEGVERKMYVYFLNIADVAIPSTRDLAWHLRFPLDWKSMHEATKALKGTHDFKGFAAADHTAKTTTRKIFEASWGEVPEYAAMGGHLVAFRIVGTGFLKNMVRSIVGTLVMIGNRKAPASRVSEILASKNRSLVGPTAPPNGLWLWDVLY